MLILFIILILFIFLNFIVLSYNAYNKTLCQLYRLKSDIYDEFSSGEQQKKYKEYFLNQIDYNLGYFNTHKVYKGIFGLHFFKEWILNDIFKFPLTIEQEDIYLFHQNNLIIMAQTKQLPFNLIRIIKVLSRLTSYNYFNYLQFFNK